MSDSTAPVRLTGAARSWRLPSMAWLPVGSAMAACSLVLAASSARYGYHRDELYFRMLEPAWGYVDQPPLTPMLARTAGLLGDTVWAIRIPAVISVAVAILFTALTTRELGGGRGAQGLCAWAFGFASLPLILGHVLVTATVDLAVWAGVILFVVRALQRAPRWWLAAGALVGLGTYNKLLIVALLVGLAVGLLAVGPRSVFRSRWLWGAVALALVIASPNVVYQAIHDWPQLTMARALSENNPDETRAALLPFQLLILGPPLVPICAAGFVALLRRPEWRRARALAVAYPVVLVVTFIGGGQIYYPVGIMAFLFAAGCVPTANWMARGGSWRRALVAAGVALNTTVSSLLALPLLPVDVLGRTPIPEINQVARDSVGWPTYVATVADVYATLTTADQARAVLYTSNYGEAGALHRYGPAYALPAVYSGHNELWFTGPPPDTATVVVAWTQDLPGLTLLFSSCDQAAVMDNGVGLENEEQGSVVAVCRDPIGGWAAVWPALQHYD